MLMSLCSRLFFAERRSDRLSSALRTAASMSIACSENDAVSVGSKAMFQKSAVPGSRMSARRLSCACLICASAMMTPCSLLATSACACTMSIGAIVPISTRFWLSLSDCCESVSDCCCAFRLLIA